MAGAGKARGHRRVEGRRHQHRQRARAIRREHPDGELPVAGEIAHRHRPRVGREEAPRRAVAHHQHLAAADQRHVDELPAAAEVPGAREAPAAADRPASTAWGEKPVPLKSAWRTEPSVESVTTSLVPSPSASHRAARTGGTSTASLRLVGASKPCGTTHGYSSTRENDGTATSRSPGPLGGRSPITAGPPFTSSSAGPQLQRGRGAVARVHLAGVVAGLVAEGRARLEAEGAVAGLAELERAVAAALHARRLHEVAGVVAGELAGVEAQRRAGRAGEVRAVAVLTRIDGAVAAVGERVGRRLVLHAGALAGREESDEEAGEEGLSHGSAARYGKRHGFARATVSFLQPRGALARAEHVLPVLQ